METFFESNIAAIFRILIDGFLLSLARRKANSHQASVESTFVEEDKIISPFGKIEPISLPTSGRYERTSFRIATANKCNITYVRFSILLAQGPGESGFSPYVYIDINGRGRFNVMVMTLPFNLSNCRPTSSGISVELDEKRSTLTLIDERENQSRDEPFEFRACNFISIPVHESPSGLQFSFPIDTQLRTIGQPWTISDSLSRYNKTSGKTDTTHFPAIDVLEISAKMLPKGYKFSEFEIFPQPEFRSMEECRWISTTSEVTRHHSSISFRLLETSYLNRSGLERVSSGFSVGLWSAVFVTVAIDMTWTIVNLLGTRPCKLNCVTAHD